MQLKGSARKYLRGLAHNLTPVVHLGKEGLSEATVRAIQEAFANAELIKVKLLGTDRHERADLAAAIDAAVASTCVGLIGQMAILYRQHPEEDKRRISLPG
jgi:RNA-binding protein